MNAIQALTQQRLLLQLEYQTEKEAFRRQTEEKGVARLVKRGDVWWPVRVGKSYYNSLNQFCIEIFRTTDIEIEHNFEFGKPVMFFAMESGKLRYLSFTGTVSYVADDRMVVCVPDGTMFDADAKIGVQLSFDETSYKMMFDALDRVMRSKGRLGYLRDLF